MHTFRPTTRFIGQYFRHLAEVGSTSDELLLEADTLPEGAILLADCQNAGRGQNGRVWQAASGQHLTFSLLLKPQFLPASELYSLNMLIALGLVDALSRFSQENLLLKWPNDIFAACRKLGGMLIETNLQGNYVRQAVIGIGLNINESMREKDGLRAISLYDLTGTTHDRYQLLEQIADCLEHRYLTYQQMGAGNLLMEYQRKLLGYQENRTFQITDGAQFKGMIMGVNNAGKLLVRHHDRLRAYAHGEIKMLFEDEIAID